ncbi:MAG: hypothetical protein PF795_15440, partial [Kiritimatiellae bacterium]|nr:hypothetical protein [Kiritimatiellia bacterium]
MFAYLKYTLLNGKSLSQNYNNVTFYHSITASRKLQSFFWLGIAPIHYSLESQIVKTITENTEILFFQSTIEKIPLIPSVYSVYSVV